MRPIRRHETRVAAGIGFLSMLLIFASSGCKQKTRPPAKKPVPPASVPASAPATVPASTPESAPATRPATKPATLPAPVGKPAKPVASHPASRFDSSPPYPVELYVQSPTDKQPGWLKVMSLADGEQLAVCKGQFPEKNRIYVETDNVRRLQLHIGYLPLAERKRIFLRIDKQTIELARKRRKYVVLERRVTGEWNVLPGER